MLQWNPIDRFKSMPAKGKKGGEDKGVQYSGARVPGGRGIPKLNTISAYTRQNAKSKYRNRIRFERASQEQSSDTHKTPYDRAKRCRERKINIKASERVNCTYSTTAWLLSKTTTTLNDYKVNKLRTTKWPNNCGKVPPFRTYLPSPRTSRSRVEDVILLRTTKWRNNCGKVPLFRTYLPSPRTSRWCVEDVILLRTNKWPNNCGKVPPFRTYLPSPRTSRSRVKDAILLRTTNWPNNCGKVPPFRTYLPSPRTSRSRVEDVILLRTTKWRNNCGKVPPFRTYLPSPRTSRWRVEDVILLRTTKWRNNCGKVPPFRTYLPSPRTSRSRVEDVILLRTTKLPNNCGKVPPFRTYLPSPRTSRSRVEDMVTSHYARENTSPPTTFLVDYLCLDIVLLCQPPARRFAKGHDAKSPPRSSLGQQRPVAAGDETIPEISTDLPWRSRLMCHRSGVREALGSNPEQGMDVLAEKQFNDATWKMVVRCRRDGSTSSIAYAVNTRSDFVLCRSAATRGRLSARGTTWPGAARDYRPSLEASRVGVHHFSTTPPPLFLIPSANKAPSVLTSGLCVLCGLERETSSARREIQLLQPNGWYKGPSTPPALSFGNDERGNFEVHFSPRLGVREPFTKQHAKMHGVAPGEATLIRTDTGPVTRATLTDTRRTRDSKCRELEKDTGYVVPDISINLLKQELWLKIDKLEINIAVDLIALFMRRSSANFASTGNTYALAFETCSLGSPRTACKVLAARFHLFSYTWAVITSPDIPVTWPLLRTSPSFCLLPVLTARVQSLPPACLPACIVFLLFSAHKRGSCKGYTGSPYKCAIAITGWALNWCAEFSSVWFPPHGEQGTLLTSGGRSINSRWNHATGQFTDDIDAVGSMSNKTFICAVVMQLQAETRSTWTSFFRKKFTALLNTKQLKSYELSQISFRNVLDMIIEAYKKRKHLKRIAVSSQAYGGSEVRGPLACYPSNVV
ncbi:hypothetical protein PR048_028531 [Dryococelus australis]|uniref:Uncharacterized protein n=1 Tax=Dryococelus australis TaxID=614101 RepID=A0ABQ9GAU7_9NEOP|nr:hypothetical protein PR048_028531 [Dryococelus australis]